MKNIGYAGLSAALCLAFALPALAQQPSAAELACNKKYGDYYNKQGDVALFDLFVKDETCKDNQYRNGAYSLLFNSMKAAKNWKGVMDLAVRYEKEVPNADVKSKSYYLGEAMSAAAQPPTGDAVKVLEFGDKVLAIDPDNLNALLIVATTIPLNLPTDAAAMDKALTKAFEYAKKLVAMKKPDQLQENTWQTAVIGPAHGVIGFFYLNKSMFVEAEEELAQTVKINPKDQVAWYRYGTAAYKIAVASNKLIDPAYAALNAVLTPGPERDELLAKRDAAEKDFMEKREKAIDVLISAVALPDTNIQKAADIMLKSLYNPLHNNTDAGLNELIEKRRNELK